MMRTLFILCFIRSDFLRSQLKFNIPVARTRNFELFERTMLIMSAIDEPIKILNECDQIIEFSESKDVLRRA